MSKRSLIKWLERLGFERSNSDYWNYRYVVDGMIVSKTLYISFHKTKKANYISFGSNGKTKLEDLKENDFFDYLKKSEILKGDIRKYKLKELGI